MIAIGVACEVWMNTAIPTAKKLMRLPTCDTVWVATNR
jgi:hypothetical protein